MRKSLGTLWALSLTGAFVPMAQAAPALADLSPPPLAKEVENLGSAWPGPVPQEDLPPLGKQELSNLLLEQAATLADLRNPTLRAAWEAVKASQANLGAAYASWWPSLNLSLNGGPSGTTNFYSYSPNSIYAQLGMSGSSGSSSSSSSPTSSSSSLSTYSSSQNQVLTTHVTTQSYFQAIGELQAVWKVIDPVRAPSIWKNKYLLRQAVDSYIIAKRDNRLNTQKAFVDLQQAHAQMLTGRQIVRNDQILLAIAMAKKQLGVASKLDVAKQETLLFADQANLKTAEQNFAVAQAALAAYIVANAPDLLKPGTELAPIGQWSHSLPETLLAAEQYRKVIEQRLLDVKTQQADAQIALAPYRPTVELINTLIWTKSAGYAGQAGPPYVFNARSDSWNPASILQVTITPFDGGQARLKAEAFRRQSEQSLQTYFNTLNEVRRDVQQQYSKVLAGRDVVILTARQVGAANEALRVQSLRFNAGFGNSTDVVQSQLNLTQAVASYITALAEYNRQLLAISRSSGLAIASDAELNQKVGNPLANLRIDQESLFRRAGVAPALP
jgi:outer membrane protein TolC